MTRNDYFNLIRARINAMKLILGELENVAPADPVDTGTIHTLAQFMEKNAAELSGVTGQYLIESTAARFSVHVLPEQGRATGLS